MKSFENLSLAHFSGCCLNIPWFLPGFPSSNVPGSNHAKILDTEGTIQSAREIFKVLASSNDLILPVCFRSGNSGFDPSRRMQASVLFSFSIVLDCLHFFSLGWSVQLQSHQDIDQKLDT